ncbi:ATP-binding protein [Leisingera sp. ANG59]|uniref:ATP-binding protein n=1 Tax=Leisingera sp. ANG59 TaxID=2675221 RepID=UPI00157264ED|nr:ATP-binding protein [Leisingera sp. ANG59]NSY41405.1 HAMP domain-containing protein [Leisingera sp. ANG59]
MKVFDSLRARTVVIVIAGLVISNAIGYVLYSRDKQETLIFQDAFDMAERAAGISRLLRDIPDDWNAEIVAASDSRAFRVWASETPPFDSQAPTTEEEELETYVVKLVPRIRDNEMRVWFRPELPEGIDLPSALFAGEPATMRENREGWLLVLSINHAEASWLNFYGRTVPETSYFPTFLALNLLMAVFGLGLVALWLVNRVTAPLQNLAQAAERLGLDLTSEPLSEAGPEEVRVAARAFNAMQARLIRQVEGRTVMLAAISHDLRTPITQLRLRTELAPESNERAKTLATLDDMNVIIGTCLDFARVSNDGEPRTTVDLGSLVQSICDDFADIGGDVTYEGPETTRYFCKRIALKRAITNIIDNALTYGGQARVTLSPVGRDLVICVEDDGPGIPDAEIETVFQPFCRLASDQVRPSDGVGLGLSIAQSIIEDHGGTVALSNRQQGGLLVMICLPNVLKSGRKG